MHSGPPSRYTEPSAELVPLDTQPAAFGFRPDAAVEPAANPLRRYLSSLKRYKWIVLGVVALGTAAGAFATRFVQPEYTVRSTVWIETEGRGAATSGPIRSAGLLQASAWVELLRSYAVLDHVVREERLYLQPGSPADAEALASLTLKEQFRPGEYRLTVDRSGRSFRLATRDGATVQEGAVGDSIGSAVGFSWLPPRQLLTPDRTVNFTVVTPRDAAVELSRALRSSLTDKEGNFLRLELDGTDPRKITSVINTLTDRYISVAAELKRAKLKETANILQEQLAYAANNLQQEEGSFQGFRVQTITMPSERGVPVAPGVAITQDPVFQNYFQLKLEKESIRRDRDAIARVTRSGGGGLPLHSLEAIPSVQQSSTIRAALAELTTKEAELRAMRTKYTDLYDPVRRLQGEVETLERSTIPGLVSGLNAELAAREAAIDALIGSAAGQLQQIPPRAIEEARRERRVASAEQLYKMLQQRYEEARLAEATTVPDIRVLDQATVPFSPSKDPRIQLFLLFSLGSLGLVLAGVVAFDRFNPKLVYPEQVTGGLGLPVLGAIPRARKHLDTGVGSTAHLVEAFRSLRLNVVHATGASGSRALTVSSPGSGEGKSFVTVNLALSFAEQGHRTLLIDGDLRRGTLHHLLNFNRKPGLTDYLQGTVPASEIVQTTAYPHLDVIGSGTRTQAGPELLGSETMAELLADLRSEYAVILVDSPPMGACVDPLVLGTLTRDMLVVLRTDVTSRSMAESNMAMLDRLPIRVLGAVVNGTLPNGVYSAYEYLPGYEVADLPDDRLGSGEVRQLQGA
ncbi:MAG TPA: polysaccharide biosynthesis tyrosine autokinase [Longimicrobiaceae bacterium]|nr:polysaccharide biosynthesis tyrosine autokinase [Longimicrobiaceae bacterium]